MLSERISCQLIYSAQFLDFAETSLYSNDRNRVKFRNKNLISSSSAQAVHACNVIQLKSETVIWLYVVWQNQGAQRSLFENYPQLSTVNRITTWEGTPFSGDLLCYVILLLSTKRLSQCRSGNLQTVFIKYWLLRPGVFPSKGTNRNLVH
jgi:hypothetical protein